MSARDGEGGSKIVGDKSQDAIAVTVKVYWQVGTATAGLKL